MGKFACRAAVVFISLAAACSNSQAPLSSASTSGGVVGMSGGTTSGSASSTTGGTSSGGASGTTGLTTTSGSTSSGSSTGGTTAGLASCGPGRFWYGDHCLRADCVGATPQDACALNDGGIGSCGEGVCNGSFDSNDNANCGLLGASCPPGSSCSSGRCYSDAGEVDSCVGVTCAAGMQCGFYPTGSGTFCGVSNCSPGHDYETCVTSQQADTCCGSTCTDIGADPNNCGACGLACDFGSVCQATNAHPDQGVCLPTSCTGQVSGTACLSNGRKGVCCGGSDCVDVASDTANCGFCGLSCPTDAGFECHQSQCEFLDDGGNFTYCGDNTLTCPTGWTCSPIGLCLLDCASAPDGVSCGSYYSLATQFGGTLSQSCCSHVCADLGIDPANCGVCGFACSAGEACNGGLCKKTDCSLSSGAFTTCAMAGGDGGLCCGGQCVDPTSDVVNCGRCGVSCAVGSSCAAGICGPTEDGGPCGGTCPSGTFCLEFDNACHTPTCGPNDTGETCALVDGGSAIDGTCCNGTCLDLGADPNNCGFCGQACGESAQCIGTCAPEQTCGSFATTQCAAGLVCFGGVLCVSTSCAGRDNGGSCLFGADNPSLTNGGSTTIGTCCNGSCVDVTQDPNNCGICGASCPSGICLAGFTEFTIACFDNQPTSDCPLSCAAGSVCFHGGCIDSLCEAGSSCAAQDGGVAFCCGQGACADLLSDPQHCGSCDTACPVGQSCSAGTCSGSPACAPGRWGAFCDPDAGTDPAGSSLLCCPGLGCADVSSDDQNCGSCGRICPSGLSCTGGRCG
jgi:hypothetical protein